MGLSYLKGANILWKKANYYNTIGNAKYYPN